MPMKLNSSPDTLWLCLCAVPTRAETRSRFLQLFLANSSPSALEPNQSHNYMYHSMVLQAVPTELPGVSLGADQTTRRGDQRAHAQPLTSHAHHSPQQ